MSVLWRPSVAAAALALISACRPSDQSQARRALAQTEFSRCLKEAHWIATERTGALTFNPFSGLGFIAFDRPIKKLKDVESISFVPLLVGQAKSFPIYHLDAAYKRAGSPLSPTSAGARTMGFDEHLFHRDEVGGGWVRGRAKGWVTLDDNYSCASDMGSGRFFIVTKFYPFFPIGRF